MTLNYLKTLATAPIVLNADKMVKAGISLNDFCNKPEHAVFYSDNTKIGIDYYKTGVAARQETWIKEHSKFFIFEESAIGIESFHKINNAFEALVSEIYFKTINKTNLFEKTVSQLKTEIPDLFTSSSYEEFIKVGRTKISKSVNYTDSCYSKNLFKAIYFNNKAQMNDSTVFTFFEFKSGETGFKVNFTDGSESFYDYSTKPPRGTGGPLFKKIITELELIEKLSTGLS